LAASRYGNPVLDSPAGQYNALFGGNPQLKPEKADSYTFGFVVEPMRNMSLTLDFFDIKVKDVVGNLPSTQVLTQCLTNNLFCNLITRDSQGTLWLQPTGRIIATNQNLGKLSTQGIDVGFNYAHKIEGYGSMAYSFVGTYLKKLEVEPVPGLGSYDCKGLYGSSCGIPSPQWRHKARATWTTPWNFDVSLTWRHLDSVDHTATSSNPLLSGTVNAIERTLGAQEYFDVAASWAATKQFTLRGGINNLGDRDPPISSLVGAGFGNGNTFPGVYDALGRRVFLNATYKF
jgi:outer membrane receptor protein involved in Fe transport